jgi:hypothetical protein
LTANGVDVLILAWYQRRNGAVSLGGGLCDRDTLEQRASEVRRWLREKMRELSLNGDNLTSAEGEKAHVRGDCVLVTHGGFLHLLTEDWEGFDVKAGQLQLSTSGIPMTLLLEKNFG